MSPLYNPAVMIPCPICGHSQIGHSSTPGSAKYDTKDSLHTMNICHVAVRVPLPNARNESLMVECGCDGTGPVRETAKPAESVVITAPDVCIVPGCDEFSTISNMFCGPTHMKEFMDKAREEKSTFEAQAEVSFDHEPTDDPDGESSSPQDN